MSLTIRSLFILAAMLCSAASAQSIDLRVQHGTTTQGFYAGRPPAPVFNAGNHVNATVTLSESHQQQFADNKPKVRVTLKSGNTPLASHQYRSEYSGGQLRLALVPNPAIFPDESWTGRFALALARLPAGEHPLLLEVAMSTGDNEQVVGSVSMTYNNRGGNADYETKAVAIEEKAGKDATELEQAFIAEAGEMHIDTSRYTLGQKGKQVSVTVVNNCGNNVRPFRYGERDWIVLDGNGGSRRFSAEVGTPVYRSDSGSPTRVATLSEGHEGGSISLCN